MSRFKGVQKEFPIGESLRDKPLLQLTQVYCGILLPVSSAKSNPSSDDRSWPKLLYRHSL